MIFVNAAVHIRPEGRDAFLAGAHRIIAATVKEAGCLAYDLHQSITDPNRYVFVEKWTDKAALDAHYATAHLKAWREVGKDIVVSRAIEIIHPDTVETL